jgi:hypothetical protein
MLRRALAGVTVAVVLIGAGCGGGGDPPPPGTASAAEYLITPAEISRQPANSPQRALLSWWRSVQYNDLDGYVKALAAPLRSQREQGDAARDDLALASGELIRSQPKIDNVQEADGEATIFTRIESRQPVGATRFTTSSSPQAFTLVREGDEWKLADDFYVTNRATNIRKAQNELERSAAGGD